MPINQNMLTWHGWWVRFLKRHPIVRQLLAVALPIGATILQWELAPYLPPSPWLFLYPAIFFAGWLGGTLGGLLATLIALCVGIFFFVPPQFTWALSDLRYIFSITLFSIMGIVFSWLHGHVQQIRADLDRFHDEMLNSSQERLQSALDAARAGLWEWNLSTNENLWSDQLWQLYHLGLNSVAPSYEAWQETLDPEDKEIVSDAINQATKNNEDFLVEWRIKRHDPQEKDRWLMAIGKPVGNPDEKPCVYRGIVVDITRRKYLENKIRDYEQFLADSQAIAHIGSWMVDAITKKVTWSDETFRIFGLPIKHDATPSLPEFLGFFHEDDRSSVQNLLEGFTIGDNENTVSLECRTREIEGSIRWLYVVGCTKPEIGGKPKRIIGKIQDITRRKQDEAKLNLQARALEAAANGIMITNAAGIIEWVNTAFTELTGYSKAQAVGSDTDQLFRCDVRHPALHKNVWDTISKGHVWHGEIEYERKDGSHYLEDQKVTPVVNEQGAIQHYIAVKQDITLRKQNEKELEQHQKHLEHMVDERTQDLNNAKIEAERLTQSKSAFLAMMSHEIRSPMNAMMGFFYLLEQQPLGQEARELVFKVRNAGQSLLTIINDILDFSKIESGHLDIEHEPFKLSEIIDRVAGLMAAATGDKNIELIVKPCPSFADYLIGDGLRLQQVLVNLTSNAIKFTETGEVELSVSIKDQELPESITLHFEVRDTGIGIAPDKITEIFTAFTQADATITRRFGGTGLGLSISRQLVELMGGSLHVDSEPGSGSSFWFELKFDLNQATVSPPPQKQSLELLVVDDCDAARAAMVAIINDFGWTVESVSSGEEAFAKAWQRADTIKPYSIILLDWQMPGMDGLATAKAIKTSLKVGQQKPAQTPIIIMVSAFASAGLVTQPGIEWIDAMITKPITPSSLHDTIFKVLSSQARGKELMPEKLTVGDKPQLTGLRILVVDDSDINREVAERILKRQGATVHTADNGRCALDWLSSHSNSVDIILMDVQMPEMDGYETTAKIKSDPRWTKLPIIALTAGAFLAEQDSARAAGMDGFVPKPFNVNQLIKVIRQFTQRNDTLTNHATSSLSGRLPLSIPENIDAMQPVLPDIDISDGLTRFGVFSDYYHFLGEFPERFANVVDEVIELIQTGNLKKASSLVHDLKGVAGNIALSKVAYYASQLEVQFLAGSIDASDIEILRKVIVDACQAISDLTINKPDNE